MSSEGEEEQGEQGLQLEELPGGEAGSGRRRSVSLGYE